MGETGCPNCGAPLAPLAAVCEDCGYRTGPERDAPPAETGPCERCGGPVALDATYCRHCGHSVRTWRAVPTLLMIVGFCLTASIVGAIVGVPLQLLALRLFREAREGTVVARD
ncbi:MAG: zinc ribbon domain-containing protein [Haloarculaceae archaeon]